GKKIVELRARGASKDAALGKLRATVAPDALVIAVGDDTTDEDLFRAALLASGLAVRVGEGPSVAPERLAGPEDVARFLEGLATKG
ncbi:bifunctional alpha,alpha-trehalose-phosphate synthase (UDP-forming)/trehalose-phosphatase, partial [bacterium]|nr:bifunctional alpha,alpha-trehalose-phosphate synthase (UDP-forming)/trehalose-phosphatase [bacterium]